MASCLYDQKVRFWTVGVRGEGNLKWEGESLVEVGFNWDRINYPLKISDGEYPSLPFGRLNALSCFSMEIYSSVYRFYNGN